MSARLGDWLRAEDGRIVLATGKVDIGQRITTALRLIVAEELGLEPHEVGVAPTRTGAAPDEGVTSGSNSIEASGAALRAAAATMRRAVLALAAERFGAEPDALSLEDGVLRGPGINRPLALVELAAGLDPDLPVDPDAPVVAAERRRVVGRAARPRFIEAIVEGRHRFVHDLEVAGMLHARTVRPPHAHARLVRLDREVCERLRAEGVEVVRDGRFLAVAAPGEWQAVRAAGRLGRAAAWEGRHPEGDVFAMLANNERVSLAVVEGVPREGPLPEPLEGATLLRTYERPYQLHGALGPSAALARWEGERLVVVSHSQGIYPLRQSIAECFGMPREAVEIEHMPGSGCYGHNGADDAAYEAALISRAVGGRPVLLKWTRADEHGWEPVAPAGRVTVAARLERGRVAAWSGEACSDSHGGRPRPGPDRAGPRRLAANLLLERPLEPFRPKPNMGRHAGIHRNLDPIYDFPDRRLVKHLVRGLPLRASAMRTLGATLNVLAIEGLMDELAAEAGADPIGFRLAHLSDPRCRAVLERLRGALPAVADGEGLGVAYARYKNVQTRVAVAVTVAVGDRGEVRPVRATLVADAGQVIDPAGLTAQLEGGLVQALSWALYEAVEFDRDGRTRRDWESYPVIRFDRVPRIETVLIDRPDQPPLGAGEASSGPTVAAVANAIHAATGLRLCRMPFSAEALMRAAAQG